MKTKFGLEIPTGWDVVKLKELFREKKVLSNDLDTYPLYSFTIENGVCPKTERYNREHLLNSKTENNYRVIFTDEFIFNPMNLRFGAIGRSKITYPVTVSAYYNVLELNDKNSGQFLEYILRSKRILNVFDRISIGSLEEKKRVHLSMFYEVEIPYPPLSERIEIGKILTLWDNAIQKTKESIDNYKKRNKGLSHKLFTGKKRLNGFSGNWTVVKLGEVSQRILRRNEELNDTVITISAQRGFVRQEDFFKKRVASETLSNYYLIHKGEYAYNKSYSNGYPMGAFKRLEAFEKAVVTTLYICFRLKKNVDSNFMNHFFEAGLMIPGLMRIAQEGARAHGLLNISIDDFFNLGLKIPSLEEQIAIASILETANQEVRLLEQKLETLQQQKKGLMQKLLTGEIRVKA
ncbi:MAG: restriction endonuclease subunit S [Bacteroidales bacterium]|nr:restriction endonuclease subunit S [Bacteroidales bacterium]